MRKSGPKLEWLESGGVEIGFDADGPTVALAGVLHARDGSSFIRNIEVTLSSEKDKQKRSFRWIAFKPDFLRPPFASDLREMARPFNAAQGEARTFNIIFRDVDAHRSVDAIVQTYRHHWRETERRILDWRARHGGEGKGGAHEDLIAEFKKQEACITAYTDLDRACYWEQGSYLLEARVLIGDGEVGAERSFRFSLGKLEAKLLKGNCVSMLDEPIAETLLRSSAPCRRVHSAYLSAV